jgi:hypothetical protein
LGVLQVIMEVHRTKRNFGILGSTDQFSLLRILIPSAATFVWSFFAFPWRTTGGLPICVLHVGFEAGHSFASAAFMLLEVSVHSLPRESKGEGDKESQKTF